MAPKRVKCFAIRLLPHVDRNKIKYSTLWLDLLLLYWRRVVWGKKQVHYRTLKHNALIHFIPIGNLNW